MHKEQYRKGKHLSQSEKEGILHQYLTGGIKIQRV